MRDGSLNRMTPKYTLRDEADVSEFRARLDRLRRELNGPDGDDMTPTERSFFKAEAEEIERAIARFHDNRAWIAGIPRTTKNP